ncbi:response regulator [Nonlabens sp. Hel1_33_55]|uniref:tetratricopeptide repeat-containing hybrid sensor histidine kinase/response regulator n=1 Tax=Nonlabens sp. Hel1_33_55 TaxID=1336802 RepID=UPI0012FD1A2C|nr:response regulator [Nonlabens sp. Hel1_33_55]
MSQQGRELSNSLRFYNYYTAISSNLGMALIQIEDTIQAKEVYRESLEKAKNFQQTEFPEGRKSGTLITANVDYANVLALTGNYSEAISNYIAALELTASDDIDGLFIINYNISESFLELEEPQLASKYLNESARLSNQLQYDPFNAGIELLYGKYYVQLEKYEKAKSSLEKSIEIANESDYSEVLIEAYLSVSDVYFELNDYKKAFESSKKLSVLQRDKYKDESVKAIQNARAKFNADEVQRRMQAQIEAEQLKAENKRQEVTVLWSSIALFIASILIVVLYISFYRRKKLNKQLVEKNTIYLQEKEKSDQLLTARNALFSRISHELRTPMYGIVGISNMLIDDKKIVGENKKNVQSLKYSADYLLSLINNVLEMNKLNRSSNLTLAQENFDIRELCHHAVESAKFIVPHHTNTFHINISDDVAKIYNGDAVKLMQVLINVLGNSNKFTKNGDISLNITKTENLDNYHSLDFLIKDTGKGIDKRKLNDLFDESKFINHNEENEGTGLGLPISNKILELQDSELTVESEKGNGTTVKFNLKLEAVEVPFEELHREASIPEQTLKGIKLLIVEDNKINQLVTKKIIEGFDGTYDLADSGKAAIQMVKENTYDIILMDINMPPGMDGFEATSRIREFQPTIPIIALTAVEQLEIEERMKDSSMDDYIIKPFKSKEFVDKIFKNLPARD